MPTLTVSATTDYRAPNDAAVTGQNITAITFTGVANPTTATFGSNQFGGSNVSNTVAVTGNAAGNVISVFLSATGTFSASGWTFSGWTPGSAVTEDTVRIVGTAGNDTITGSSEDDRITGGAGADILFGGAGNDSFFFAVGDLPFAGEQISGGNGTDTLYTPTTGTSLDFSTATLTSIEAVAIQSNDSVTFSGTQIGNVVGSITSVISNIASASNLYVRGASVDLSTLVFTGWDGLDYIGITGTGGNDTLTGSSQDDIISSSGGTGDLLYGGGGNDTFVYFGGTLSNAAVISGGNGTDTLRDGGGNETVDFSAASLFSIERVFVASSNTYVFNGNQIGVGAGRISTVIASGPGTIVVGGATLIDLSNLTFNGWATNDSLTINGTSSGDALTGSSQDDVMFGGIGGDTIAGSGGSNQIYGGFGNDNIYANTIASPTGSVIGSLLYGEDDNDTITGANGDDFIVGGAGLDTLIGNDGADIFEYVAGDAVAGETVDGGAGSDTVTIFDNSSVNFSAIGLTSIERVSIGNVSTATFTGAQIGNAAGRIATVISTGGSALVVNGSSVDLSNVTFTGWNAADSLTINGTAGADMLTGSTQSDVIYGGGGGDTLIGGAGNDNYYIIGTGSQITEAVGQGIDTVFYTNSGAVTLDANVEYAFSLGTTSGLTGNDLGDVLIGGYATVAQTLIGGAGNDYISGTSAADVLTGNGGDDTLLGRGGGDTLTGGGGNDSYYVESILDLIVEGAGAGSGLDIVYTNVNTTLAANVEYLFTYGAATSCTGNAGDNALLGVYSTQGVALNGGVGNDTIYGSGFADALIGGSGNDTLFGSAGGPDGAADSMTGGTNDDTYFVQEASDSVLENANEGTDAVYAAINYTLGTNLETLFIYGSATSATGNSADNTIIGSYISSGTTTLDGAGGNDRIIGGGANDTIIGGAGNDMLTGSGGADTFQFRAGFGLDTVTDFTSNAAVGVGDRIDVQGVFANFAAIQAASTVVGGSTVITLNAQNTITLTGFTTLHDYDFVF